MRNKLVYDLPTRLFHWLFTGLFIVAFFIAKVIDDESYVYSYHMLAGITLSFVVLLRILWGFVGTKNARFANFPLSYSALFSYFQSLLRGDKKKWSGHNPASSWAALIMLALALALGVTGYLMTSGPNKETYEDIHEIFANAFVLVVIAHIAGLILHTLRHKDGVGFSMLDGKKQDVPETDVITSSRPVLGLLLLAIVTSFVIYLVRQYDTQKRTLNLFGTTLQMGENEKSSEGHENNNKGDDDDDD